MLISSLKLIPDINVFITTAYLILQTGDIFMFRGMMDILENDDQVAAVLAHEISHAVLDHGVSSSN